MENKENIFLCKIQKCSTSNISHLKKQYGLKTKKYNKGDK